MINERKNSLDGGPRSNAAGPRANADRTGTNCVFTGGRLFHIGTTSNLCEPDDRRLLLEEAPQSSLLEGPQSLAPQSKARHVWTGEPVERDAAYFRRAEFSGETSRGDTAAATWIFRGDGSRRRRGYHA